MVNYDINRGIDRGMQADSKERGMKQEEEKLAPIIEKAVAKIADLLMISKDVIDAKGHDSQGSRAFLIPKAQFGAFDQGDIVKEIAEKLGLETPCVTEDTDKSQDADHGHPIPGQLTKTPVITIKMESFLKKMSLE